ncbi:hypothetical protein DM80_6221 [Burkholderia multivorans]|jgi:hypothetical protein|nr:hypothetical protein DM80_6221 [Burkholderia multivorans]
MFRPTCGGRHIESCAAKMLKLYHVMTYIGSNGNSRKPAAAVGPQTRSRRALACRCCKCCPGSVRGKRQAQWYAPHDNDEEYT